MIESLEVAFRRAVHERATSAREQLLPSVRPIVASDDGTRPFPLATCILVEISDRKFVVTASHVLDASQNHALFVIGTAGTEPLQIRGRLIQTPLPATGDRRHDKVDLGFWEVDSAAAEQLGKVRFLTEQDFSANRTSARGRQYMAMGFPYSRNKRAIDHVIKAITPVVRTYTSETAENPRLAKELGVTGDNHYFLNFTKSAHYADGATTNTFAPTGMSGGPLVDLGSFVDVQNYDPSDSVARVAGVVLEWHKKDKAIVAIKIEHVRRAIGVGRDLL